MKKYAGINTFSRLISSVGSEFNTKLNSDDQITETEVYEMWGAAISNDSNITENHTHDFVNGVCSVCGAEDPNYIEVAPDGELSNWNYTLDDTNGTVTLNRYIGSATDVTVYALYQLNNNIYNTKIASNDNDATSNYMFADNTTITSITFNEGIDTSETISMAFMFSDTPSLTTINGLEYLDTTNVIDMIFMFYECTSLTSIIGLENFDTSNVTDMSYMFYKCKALTSLDLTGWDTSNVTDMSYMFNNCKELTSLDLTSFDTSKVTDMSGMFNLCKVLTILDVSGFNTSKVTSMDSMFYECKALTSLDLTSFNTSNVTDMSSMFQNCSALTEIKVTTGKWYVKSSCNTSYMFSSCGCSEVTYVAA